MDTIGTCNSPSSPISCRRRLTSESDSCDIVSPCILFENNSLSNDSFSKSRTSDTYFSTEDGPKLNKKDISLVSSVPKQFEYSGVKEDEKLKVPSKLICKVYEDKWKVCHFSSLPDWLQDNDFVHKGYRPPLPSFYACFRSIFRIHTETGNIWTHLIGCMFFIWIASYVLCSPTREIELEEKLALATFFAGAIVCLGMSFTFHTFQCHSKKVGKLFNKLDYCGIAFLITGSFVPWLYYGFYCEFQPKLIYLVSVIVLGLASILISLPDKFSEPRFRNFRAGLFMGFGLSGVVPAVHYIIAEGWIRAVYEASLGWLCLMGALYIIGGLFYASRIPERFYPGKFDIWLHSHQIFHILVIVAACVHYHGISKMAMYRLTNSKCNENPTQVIPSK